MQQDVVIKVTAHQLIDLSAVPCGTHDGLQAPLVWAGTTVPWQRGGGHPQRQTTTGSNKVISDHPLSLHTVHRYCVGAW